MKKIDHYLPVFDFNEIHSIDVNEPGDQVYKTIKAMDFGRSRIVRLLFALRGLPGGMASLSGFIEHGFILLEEHDNREIVLGFVGKPWKKGEQILRLTPGAFSGFYKKGYVKCAWNFHLNETGEAKTRVTTETRIRCLDPASKRLFSLYWLVISRFSGFIRKSLLTLIKTECEK